MALETSQPRSRRALLAAAAGAAAATVASALERPGLVSAADGETVHVGGEYAAESVTKFDTGTTGQTALWGRSGSGTGVRGSSTSGGGVRGDSTFATGVQGSSSTSFAVYGEAAGGSPAVAGVSTGYNTGVQGYSGASNARPASPDKTGVYGYAGQDATAAGVRGESATGDGVRGSSGGNEKSGVYGVSSVVGGYGVFGRHAVTNNTGSLGSPTGGVRGDSSSGVGVYGFSATYLGVRGSTNSGTGVVGDSVSGPGVYGSSRSGPAVQGLSDAPKNPAVLGEALGNSTGVLGHSSSGVMAPPNPPAKTGVYGLATQDATAVGVKGKSTAGRGVQGEAASGIGVRAAATTGTGAYVTTTSGTAVYAQTGGLKSGLALRTVGRVRFDNSVGIATVAAGTSSVTVTPGIDLTATSAVVATLQGSAGGTLVERVSVNATTDQFTIYLTKNTTAAVKVAWHVFG
jgi:hypothetical protein